MNGLIGCLAFILGLFLLAGSVGMLLDIVDLWP